MGVVIIFWKELQLDTPNLIYGASLIFLSALTYAIYLVGSGQFIPKFGVVTFTSYTMIVASLGIIFQYLIFDRNNLLDYSLEVYFLSLILAIFCTIIPSYFISSAIVKLGASNVAGLGSLGPIATIILAAVLLDESFFMMQIFGAAVVIFGIYFLIKKR